MSVRPLVEIHCEGNDKVGYGHIRRSSTLAAQLERDGLDVRLLGLSQEARRWLPTPSFAGRSADIQIFDSPYGIDDKLRVVRANRQITVALDWFGDAMPDVNIAVYPHAEVRGTRGVYVGFEYILIREEIAMLHRVHATQSAKSVLVFIGGGDLLNQGHEAARLLSWHGLDVTLVQGPLATNRSDGEGYRVLINPEDLPQLLEACDWAVTNGGGCMFETMCVGKAAFVLPQTEAEKKLACFAAEQGAVLGIGLDGLHKFDIAELERVAEKGANLVDGGGAARISAIVRGLYESR